MLSPITPFYMVEKKQYVKLFTEFCEKKNARLSRANNMREARRAEPMSSERASERYCVVGYKTGRPQGS